MAEGGDLVFILFYYFTRNTRHGAQGCAFDYETRFELATGQRVISKLDRSLYR